jgi:hypothetical protein
MSQTFQINAWYHDVDPARVHWLATEVLRGSGFDFDPLPAAFHAWDLVRLGEQATWCALSPRQSDLRVFELKADIDSREALLDTFLKAFDRLLAEPGLVPAECALSACNPDVYPFFAHGFGGPSGPVTLIDVSDPGVESAERTPADADYWAEAGRALHFVATATTARVGVDPASFSRLIRAEPITVPDGVIFDCGWSARWPPCSTRRSA